MPPAPFDCLACAACCRHAGGVVLLDADVARLARRLRIPKDEVRVRYTSDGVHLRTKGRDDPTCIFLLGTRCSVYGARPQVCRDYLVGGGACLRERRQIGLPIVPESHAEKPPTDHRRERR